MPDARLQVVFEAVDKFSSELKALNTQVKTSKEAFNRDFGDISRTVRNAGLALTGFGAAGVLAIRSFSNAALEQRQAMAQLQVAVGNTGVAFDRVKGRIEEITLALQRKTNFGDEEQLRALALMVPALGDVNVALTALPTALDLAAATGQDLSIVAMQLGRILSGQQATMRGLPVDFSKATTAADRLSLAQKALGGTAEATLDPFKRMSNAFGELKERMGEELLPTVSRFTGVLTDLAITAERVNPAILQIAGTFTLVGTALASMAGPLLLFLGMMPTVAASFVTLSTGIVAFAVAAAPVIVIIAAIGAGLAFIASIADNVRRFLTGKEILTPWEQLNLLLDAAKRKFEDLTSSAERATAAITQTGQAMGGDWAEGLTGNFKRGASAIDSVFKRMIEQFEALGIPLKPLLDEYEALIRAGVSVITAQQVAGEWARKYLDTQFDIIAASKKGGEAILAAMRQAGVGFLEMRKRLEELPLKQVFDEAKISIDAVNANLDAQIERLSIIAQKTGEMFAKTPKTRLEEMKAQLKAAEEELAAGLLIPGGISPWRESWLRSLINNLRNFIAELENPSSAGQFGETPPGFPGSPEPTLQHGGIVTRPTRAIIGEAGPEAVIPLRGRQAPMFNVTLTLDGRVLTTVLGRLAENDEAVRSS